MKDESGLQTTATSFQYSEMKSKIQETLSYPYLSITFGEKSTKGTSTCQEITAPYPIFWAGYTVTEI